MINFLVSSMYTKRNYWGIKSVEYIFLFLFQHTRKCKIFFFLFFIFSLKKSLKENSNQFNRTFSLGSPLSNETKIVQIGWKMRKLSWSKALKNKHEKNASKEFWLGFWLQKPAKCLVHFTNFWYEFHHFVFRFLKKNKAWFKLDKKTQIIFWPIFNYTLPLSIWLAYLYYNADIRPPSP